MTSIDPPPKVGMIAEAAAATVDCCERMPRARPAPICSPWRVVTFDGDAIWALAAIAAEAAAASWAAAACAAPT